ncbi:hypothetical protein [Dysgonomonas sp. 520]|uniref:hypothetical protein n=1 Tax=Dysgonomonas sp. 520 TaxID=2302931 RepID=UPI0013D2BF0B|nr:hypothetical protein [Dysgonomonas sp. 520]NDW10816.1 hypothetical protein [Dysgonomonas sp. 520]
MKLQILTIISGLLIAFTVNAQVGVHTESPKALLHIDTNKDTDASNITTDDVVVTDKGHLGIGTVKPDTTLHVAGTFRLVDGNQQNERVLLCDANGNAKWADAPRTLPIYSNQTGVQSVHSILTGTSITKNPTYMGVSITLPAGSWQITFIATYRNLTVPYASILWDLSTSSVSIVRDDVVHNRRGMSGSGFIYTYLPTSVVYFVNLSTTTTYYMWARSTQLDATQSLPYSGEGRMWAIPFGG